MIKAVTELSAFLEQLNAVTDPANSVDSQDASVVREWTFSNAPRSVKVSFWINFGINGLCKREEIANNIGKIEFRITLTENDSELVDLVSVGGVTRPWAFKFDEGSRNWHQVEPFGQESLVNHKDEVPANKMYQLVLEWFKQNAEQ